MPRASARQSWRCATLCVCRCRPTATAWPSNLVSSSQAASLSPAAAFGTAGLRWTNPSGTLSATRRRCGSGCASRSLCRAKSTCWTCVHWLSYATSTLWATRSVSPLIPTRSAWLCRAWAMASGASTMRNRRSGCSTATGTWRKSAPSPSPSPWARWRWGPRYSPTGSTQIQTRCWTLKAWRSAMTKRKSTLVNPIATPKRCSFATGTRNATPQNQSATSTRCRSRSWTATRTASVRTPTLWATWTRRRRSTACRWPRPCHGSPTRCPNRRTNQCSETC
mmetsp:Transcript_43472/g.134270  ORF Transcript_43472/g.134270 Transcript_43472/m.134270 type:complete len:279 (+) Transcript_43472:304-1140(+)